MLLINFLGRSHPIVNEICVCVYDENNNFVFGKINNLMYVGRVCVINEKICYFRLTQHWEIYGVNGMCVCS